MDLATHLAQPGSSWMAGRGPDAEVAVSSRVRLARNLERMSFPGRQRTEDAAKVLTLAERAAGALGSNWDFYRLASLHGADRRLLVEKHLISPQLAQAADHGALILRQDESAAVMVNEEDHLRIQTLTSGRDLFRAWQAATAVDDRLEADLEYAFDGTLGYLTACPTNLGTGMRASVMVHLPGLVLTGRAGVVLEAVGKMGLAVRGLYGEGTDAVGNLFQVSNRRTLGPTEDEIVRDLDQVVEQLAEAERDSRHTLLTESGEGVADRVGRASGILRNAHLLSTAEAMRLISDVRLGVALGLVPDGEYETLNELLVICRTGYLAHVAGRELTQPERDVLRARLVRERITGQSC